MCLQKSGRERYSGFQKPPFPEFLALVRVGPSWGVSVNRRTLDRMRSYNARAALGLSGKMWR
jgi:hypothetical protein